MKIIIIKEDLHVDIYIGKSIIYPRGADEFAKRFRVQG